MIIKYTKNHNDGRREFKKDSIVKVTKSFGEAEIKAKRAKEVGESVHETIIEERLKNINTEE